MRDFIGELKGSLNEFIVLGEEIREQNVNLTKEKLKLCKQLIKKGSVDDTDRWLWVL